jgi:hypothetical protein
MLFVFFLLRKSIRPLRLRENRWKIITYPRYQFDFLKSVRIELEFSVGNAICSSAGRSQHKTAAIGHEHGSFLRGKKQRGRRCDGWFIATSQQGGTIRKVFVVAILVLLSEGLSCWRCAITYPEGFQNMVPPLLKEIIHSCFMSWFGIFIWITIPNCDKAGHL